jgi:phage FluMu protein Com
MSLYVSLDLPLFIKHFKNIPRMVMYTCKKCGELSYLTPHAFWNITDFGAKCERCETINTITLKNGELKKKE